MSASNVILFPGCEEITPSNVVRVPRGAFAIEHLPSVEIRRIITTLQNYADSIGNRDYFWFKYGYPYWNLADVVRGYNDIKHSENSAAPGFSVGIRGNTLHIVVKLNELPD